jgi:hypothetical protein
MWLLVCSFSVSLSQNSLQGSVVFFELKHWKFRKKKWSTKCFSFLELREVPSISVVADSCCAVRPIALPRIVPVLRCASAVAGASITLLLVPLSYSYALYCLLRRSQSGSIPNDASISGAERFPGPRDLPEANRCDAHAAAAVQRAIRTGTEDMPETEHGVGCSIVDS